MMHISRLKALGILLTALLVSMLAVPSFFSEKTVQSWPAWAQRQLVLGLDLRGGSHLLLEVDAAAVRKERLAPPASMPGRTKFSAPRLGSS